MSFDGLTRLFTTYDDEGWQAVDLAVISLAKLPSMVTSLGIGLNWPKYKSSLTFSGGKLPSLSRRLYIFSKSIADIDPVGDRLIWPIPMLSINQMLLFSLRHLPAADLPGTSFP